MVKNLFPVQQSIKISRVPDQNADYLIYSRPTGSTSQEMKLWIFIFNKFHRLLLYFKKKVTTGIRKAEMSSENLGKEIGTLE